MTNLSRQPCDVAPAFWRGFRAFTPLIPGVVPFSMVAGIAAAQGGFTPCIQQRFDNWDGHVRFLLRKGVAFD
jgi:predicted branched-subunit amino acid permease